MLSTHHSTKFFPAKPSTTIYNIVFDFAGVLFNCDLVKMVQQAFPNETQPQKLVQSIFYSDLWLPFDKNTITRQELTDQLCKTLSCQPSNIDNLMRAVKEHLTPMEESIALVKELHNKGFKIYGLTNMPDNFYRHLRKHNNFWDCFSGIISSSVVHCAKPEKSIYQKLLDEYALKPEESIFLDDRLGNLTPAKELGFKTVLFINPTQARDVLTHLLPQLQQPAVNVKSLLKR